MNITESVINNFENIIVRNFYHLFLSKDKQYTEVSICQARRMLKDPRSAPNQIKLLNNQFYLRGVTELH